MAKPPASPPSRTRTRKPRTDANAPKGITTDMIQAALEANGGLVAQAAQRLGVTRQALHQRIKAEKNIALRAIQQDRLGTLADGLEGAYHKFLAKIVADGVTEANVKEVRYFLETHARERGYGAPQRMELTGKDGVPLISEAALQGLTDEELAVVRRLLDRAAAAAGPATTH